MTKTVDADFVAAVVAVLTATGKVGIGRKVGGGGKGSIH